MLSPHKVLTAIRRTDAFTEVHLSCLRSMTKMNPMPASCKLKQGEETLGVSMCWQQTWLPRIPVTPPSHAISALHAKVYARDRSQLLKAQAAPPSNSQDFPPGKGEQILSVCCLFSASIQQRPLLLEQPDSFLHCKSQAMSFCATKTSFRTPHITLVPASEVPCSSTLESSS